MEIQSLFDADGVLKFEYLDEIIEKSLVSNLMINMLETPILLTENAIHNKEFRMKMTEYMFEKYQIPALFLVKDPVLTAFSCGRSSGLVLDCGHKGSIATPVNEGYSLLKCIVKHNIGGNQITKDLYNFLVNKKNQQLRPRYTFKKKFYSISGTEEMQLMDLTAQTANTHASYENWSQMEIVREMKEEFLSISDEILQMKQSDVARVANYELPDGSSVQMNNYERQVFGEKLF